MRAFLQPPAIVASSSDDVDLFPCILSNVAGHQSAGLGVEGHPPDVSKSPRPQFPTRAVLPDKWIVGRNGVGTAVLGCSWIDSDDRAQQRRCVLPIVLWVIGAATVPDGEIEHSIGTEQNRSAVVVAPWLIHFEQLLFGLGIDRPTIGRSCKP